jgi:hypothetical protein
MALKKIVVVAAMVVGAQAFACERVQEALTLNASPVKTEKAKSKSRMIETLNKGGSEIQKTTLPKNARHDATAGVFI